VAKMVHELLTGINVMKSDYNTDIIFTSYPIYRVRVKNCEPLHILLILFIVSLTHFGFENKNQVRHK
jgi:hypothetical protein